MLRYAWFLIAAAWLVIVGTTVRGGLLQLVEAGKIEEGEVRSVMAWVGGSMALLLSIFGFIQLAAGWATPFCAYSLDWSDWAVTLTWGVNTVAVALLVIWLLLGKGAEVASRYGPAVGLNASAVLIKWGGSAALVAMVVLTFVQIRMAPVQWPC